VSCKWVLAEPDSGAVAALARDAGFHPLIARLLVIRGISKAADADVFLSCDLSSLSDPFLFKDMAPAVDRIRKAIVQAEKIVVYGDYDVDGITGAALLYHVLKHAGANVHTYIPDRLSEGYGLHAQALKHIKDGGASLVISVDCGISAFREADEAASLDLDLIITDHHEMTGVASPKGPASGEKDRNLPRARAVLHPLLLVDGASDALRERVSSLTGVGMAFKLAQALGGRGQGGNTLESYLDLVTLGTVADVGSITGENRVLVKHGLELLSQDTPAQRPGIAALKNVSGVAGRKISAGTVGFTLAPRINASGRLERADIALRLFTTDSSSEALELARTLDAVNKERQTVEETILEEARKACRGLDLSATGALVLASGQWHSGVIGIVASKLVDEFYRPAALISVKDGVGKGSARSIPGFDLYAGLAACSDLLLGFGGHRYAAGFSINEENIPRLRERLGGLVMDALGAAGFVRTISIDGPVALSDLTQDFMHEMERLAPFGLGNPEPRLGVRGLTVLSSRIVGNKHLKFRVKQDHGAALDAIAFNRSALLGKQVRDGARLAAVFTPRLTTWNGTTNVELEIRDIKTDREHSH